MTCCELAQLEPVKGVLAGLSPVYFMINSFFEGLLTNICRNVGFALLALLILYLSLGARFPAPVIFLYEMLRVRDNGKVKET